MLFAEKISVNLLIVCEPTNYGDNFFQKNEGDEVASPCCQGEVVGERTLQNQESS